MDVTFSLGNAAGSPSVRRAFTPEPSMELASSLYINMTCFVTWTLPFLASFTLPLIPASGAYSQVSTGWLNFECPLGQPVFRPFSTFTYLTAL